MLTNGTIDVDSHVLEPRDLWTTRLDEEYRDRAIRIEEVDGVEALVMAENVILAGVLAGLGGIHIPKQDLFSGSLSYEDGCPPGSNDPAGRIALYDRWGVRAGLVFPTIGILPFETDDLGLISAYCRAYNSWVADFSAETGGRAMPVAWLNLRDPVTAAAELERCIDAGFKAVFLPPELIDGRRPGDPVFDPLWERCAEAGLPLCFHVVVRFGGGGLPYQPWLDTAPGATFGFSLSAPGQIMPALTTLVLDGVFDRIPDLKVFCVEAGCGWAAHLMDRLDDKMSTIGRLQSTIEHEPSVYLRKNVWYVAEPTERSIPAMLDLVGPDRILWGSDFPHIDAHMEAPTMMRDALAGLDETARDAVLATNAIAALGLA